jgi:AcrR family transcriptional regulator
MSKVTKRALEQSLKNLLLKKPLTKITIGDITEDCGINRMTFYYHFKDIYDLVEWACLEDARRALDEKLMTPGSRDFCRSLRQSRKTNRLS